MVKTHPHYNNGNVRRQPYGYNIGNVEKADCYTARGKNFVMVAIDGKCTSGKTTLASKLAEIYDCNVFHMDDFFLRPEQRTSERFAEIGGNVDYERFQEEVLFPLRSGSG